jgi:hypothetical protein
MDALEFLARSEWPLVAITTILLLRKPLGRMMDDVTLTKLDAWGGKAEFERKIGNVRAALANMASGEPARSSESLSVIDVLAAVRERAERAGVYRHAGAWIRKSGSGLANEGRAVISDLWKSVEDMMEELSGKQLPPDVISAVQQLREAKDLALGGGMYVDPEVVVRFVDAAQDLKTAMTIEANTSPREAH